MSFCQSTWCKKQSGPDRPIIFNPQFIHHSRPEMYKINVVQLWALVPRATRVVLFSVPNRRLWLDVFVLLHAACGRFFTRPSVRPSPCSRSITVQWSPCSSVRIFYLWLSPTAGKTTIKLHQYRV